MPSVEWQRSLVEHRNSIVEHARLLGIDNIAVLKAYGRLVLVVPEVARDQLALKKYVQTLLQSEDVGVTDATARMFRPLQSSPDYPERWVEAQRLLFSAIPLMDLRADQPIDMQQNAREDLYSAAQEAADRARGVAMPSSKPRSIEVAQTPRER